MQTLTLNETQIHNLLVNKYLYITENNMLEIYDNEIVLNKNGYTERVSSINLEFEERIILNKGVIDYIRNLICNHLNLELCEVVYFSRNKEELQFKIRTNPNTKIIVCERRQAEWYLKTAGSEACYDPETKTIGHYKQLCDSAYFFCWVED